MTDRSRRRATLVAITAMVLPASMGVLVGWLMAKASSSSATPSQTAESEIPPHSPMHRVVYRYRDHEPSPHCDPFTEDDAKADAYDWCAQQLTRCEERANFRRADWPDEPLEAPEPWTEMMSGALQDCEAPLPLTIVECSEYPCVAVLGTGMTVEDRAALEVLEDQLRERLTDCPALRRDLQTDELRDVVQVFRYDVGCEVVFGVAAAPRDSELTHAIQAGDADHLLGWYYRRAEDVAAAWECPT